MAWLAREIDHCFLINKYQDQSFSSLFLSAAITFFLLNEYKQISVVEQ